MSNRILLNVGDKYNDWTVIDNNGKYDKNNHITKYLCACKCGAEKWINSSNLRKGISKCCRRCSSKGEKNGFFRGYKNIKMSLFSRIQRSAMQRNIEFDVSIEYLNELYEKQQRVCYLTNIPISFSDNTASLDRIDSSQGYVIENVMWVHKDINIMKNGYDIGYFIKMCKLVSMNNTKIGKEVPNFKFGTKRRN